MAGVEAEARALAREVPKAWRCGAKQHRGHGIARARHGAAVRGITPQRPPPLRRGEGARCSAAAQTGEPPGPLDDRDVADLAADRRGDGRAGAVTGRAQAARGASSWPTAARRSSSRSPSAWRAKDHRPDRVAVRRPARPPIRKGKLAQPNQFGNVDQLCEITANTKPGARGFILPPSSQIGNPGEDTLLPATAAELQNLDIKLREVMVDGGFNQAPTNTALRAWPTRCTSPAARNPAPGAPAAADSATAPGAEGRVSHLNVGYGLRRSCLKGDEGHQIWDGRRPSPTTPTPTPPSL